LQGPSKKINTDLALRAAWLSFIGGYTQGEIASRMAISPAKVHRLITQAQQAGLVQFHIEARPDGCLHLEEEIVQRHGLKNCLVAPELSAPDSDPDSHFRAVAAAGGQLLGDLAASADIKQIGVGKGRTLKAAIGAMRRVDRADLTIHSISGSLTPRMSANPYDVVLMLAERTGGEGYFLPVPYIAANSAERETLLGQPSVQTLLDQARRSDAFVIGIGALDGDGHVLTTGMVDQKQADELLTAGAVADMLGRFVNRDGQVVPTPLNSRAIGLHFDDLIGARVVAMAAGAIKAEAVSACLRTGIITDLVIDEPLAKQLVTKMEVAAQNE